MQALKEFLKVPHVATAWGEIVLGEQRVTEACRSKVLGLQRAEGLVVVKGWGVPSLLVFEERQWS